MFTEQTIKLPSFNKSQLNMLILSEKRPLFNLCTYMPTGLDFLKCIDMF